MAKITPKMKIADVLKVCPDAPGIMARYGFPCVGCPMTQIETLEEGAKKHGIKDKKLAKFIKELNDSCD